jgi:hypothetical protein
MQEAKHLIQVAVHVAPPSAPLASPASGSSTPPPPLPPGIALLVLELQLPIAFWWHDHHLLRTWLCRQHKAAVTVFGAIVPAGGSAWAEHEARAACLPPAITTR